MATSDPSQSESTYSLGDSSAEMVRLIEQDRHFTRAMGGLLTEQTDLSSIHRVLDVGCGPGGWALELAQAYPYMQVVGIDISARMIDYANAQARASGLDNASFLAKNALDPFDFPEGSFDLSTPASSRASSPRSHGQPSSRSLCGSHGPAASSGSPTASGE